MKIGLLSDSHGRAATTRRGVDLLLGQGAEVLLHLGDVGTVEVIDALVAEFPETGGRVPAHVVFGNTDWDADGLGRYAGSLGVSVDHPAGRLELEGGDLVFLHGHEEHRMAAALAEGVRYLCHGHTHRAADQRSGVTRIVNPGALFRARVYSVAVIDTAADEVAFYPLREPG